MVQLGEIINQLYEIDSTLRRAAAALEKLAPHGSEREQIALQLWVTLDVEAEASFRHADNWIAERDRQRAKQAE